MFHWARYVVVSLSVGLFVMVLGCANGDKIGWGGTKAPAWRLGMQIYTFKELTLLEGIDKVEALGLKYIESCSWRKIGSEYGKMTLRDATPEVRAALKQRLDQAGIQMINCYCLFREKDEAAYRQLFDFAKEMGIETLVGEPAKEQIELLDKLATEYGVNVAIHNHWKRPEKPDHGYWNPDKMAQVVEGTSKRIGASPDTGHWARSEVDSVEAVRKLEGRLITLHLKDVDAETPKARDVPWGTGVANIKGILAELDRQGYTGMFMIEYESHGEKRMKEIRECIKYFNDVKRELGR